MKSKQIRETKSIPKIFISKAGNRCRQVRLDLKLSQVEFASQLGISASYLNQIEHDVRPLTASVVAKISSIFGLDISFFSTEDTSRQVAELREVALDKEINLPEDPKYLQDVVTSNPELTNALITLYRHYQLTKEQLAEITSETRDTNLRGSISMPHEEVREFFYNRQNYIHEIDLIAETIWEQLHKNTSNSMLMALTNRLENHGIKIDRKHPLPEGILHFMEKPKKVLHISNHLSSGQQAFKMATELAFLECDDLIKEIVEETAFTTSDAKNLAYLGIANYFAAAVILPYQQFYNLAEDFRYDIERLSAYYSVSYETIAHRLSTLQRPRLKGVPFSFIRVDRAGNMSKRQSASGFHFSHSGGTCPLWAVYETFAQPGKIITQVAKMPDTKTYLWVARTVERRATRYDQPSKTFAIGLGCEIRYANKLIYADRLNVSESGPATAIGVGCRVCIRDNCPQRAFPAIGQTLDIDEHRSTVSPYVMR